MALGRVLSSLAPVAARNSPVSSPDVPSRSSISRPGCRPVRRGSDHGRSSVRAAMSTPDSAARSTARLRRLIWLCVLPVCLWSAWVAVGGIRLLDDRLDREADGLARGFAAALDAELSARMDALRILAAVLSLTDRRDEAERLGAGPDDRPAILEHLILADAGPPVRVLTATGLASGAPPPTLPAAAADAVATAARTRRPVVGEFAPGGSDRLVSPTIAVPAAAGGPGGLVLLAPLGGDFFDLSLGRLTLPDGWSMVVRDARGREIARRGVPLSEGPSEAEGPSEGGANGVSEPGPGQVQVRSQSAPWTLTLEVPAAEWRTPLIAAVCATGAGILGALLIGSLVAARGAQPFQAAVAVSSSASAFADPGASPAPAAPGPSAPEGSVPATGPRPGDAEAQLRARYGGTRVLLAEDNPVSRGVAVDLLEGAGLRVDVAGDGREVLARVRSGDYALILMDVQMPNLDGLAATRALRALPGWGSRPILAMTAATGVQDRIDCRAAGMDGFLAKPIDPNVLFSVLLQWLSTAGGGVGGAATLPARAGPQAASATAVRADAGLGAGLGVGPGITPGESGRLQQTLGRLADLPGLDLEQGLRLARGDGARYVAMLSDFVRAHREDSARLTAWLSAGDRGPAGRLAHGLKGSAGTLGIGGLAADAARLDTILGAGTDPDPEVSGALVAAIGRALEALEGVMDERPDVDPGAGSGSSDSARK